MNHTMDFSQYSAKHLAEERMPDAVWYLGGAFRYDNALLRYVAYNAKLFGNSLRLVAAGAPPCLWSLDWFKPRPLVNLQAFVQALEQYALLSVGVTLEFDSPVVTDEMIADSASNRLLQEFWRCDRVRKNAVSVANDKLAAHIRGVYPKLPMHAHLNRVAAEPGKRTAAFYNELAEKYDFVSLHPADCARPEIMDGLKEPARFVATVNDTCLRQCPCRRDHLMLLARLRKQPYSMELLSARGRYVQVAGCESVEHKTLNQKKSCILTEAELKSLYERGVRRFRVQDATLRNELSVHWSWIRGVFGHSPESDNLIAAYAASCMNEFVRPMRQMPGGLGKFQFGNYD